MGQFVLTEKKVMETLTWKVEMAMNMTKKEWVSRIMVFVPSFFFQ